MRFKAAVGSLLVSAAVAGAAVAPAAGQAGEVGIQAQPGDLCWVGNWYAPVSSDTSLVNWIYWLGPGRAFRILGYSSAPDGRLSYYGRGNGMDAGYLERFYINQSTCTS